MLVYIGLVFLILVLIEIIILVVLYNKKKIEISNNYEKFKEYNDNIIKLHKAQKLIDMDLDKQIKDREVKIKLKEQLRPKQSIFNIPGTKKENEENKENHKNIRDEDINETQKNNNKELEDVLLQGDEELSNIKKNSGKLENTLKMIDSKIKGEKIEENIEEDDIELSSDKSENFIFKETFIF